MKNHKEAHKTKQHPEPKKEAPKPRPKQQAEKPDLTYNGVINGQPT